MSTVPVPPQSERHVRVCSEWLYNIDIPEIISRWPYRGVLGFYKHEREALQAHPDAMIRVAVNIIAATPDVQDTILHAKHEARLQRQIERAQQLERLREMFPELRTPLHGSLDGACLDTATRYLDNCKRIRLKDCAQWASERHLIHADAIILAMAGDGARAIVAAHDQYGDCTDCADDDYLIVTTQVEHYRPVKRAG